MLTRDAVEGPMLRILVLMVVILFLRESFPRNSRRARNAASPYNNSLESLLSAEQICLELGRGEIYQPGPAARPGRDGSPAQRNNVTQI